MTVRELGTLGILETVNPGSEPDRSIEGVFCCDLLSIAMGRGREGAAWVTVMGNVNTLAVLSLTDMACIVLAEGTVMDEVGMAKAKQQGIAVFRTEQPVFEASLAIYRRLGEDRKGAEAAP